MKTLQVRKLELVLSIARLGGGCSYLTKEAPILCFEVNVEREDESDVEENNLVMCIFPGSYADKEPN